MSTTHNLRPGGPADRAGDVVTASGTVLRSASAAYNGDGDMLSSTDYRGNTTTFAYNADGSTDAGGPARLGDVIDHDIVRIRRGR